MFKKIKRIMSNCAIILSQAWQILWQRPRYFSVVVVVSMILVLISMILSNLGAFQFVLTAPFFSVFDKIKATRSLSVLYFTTLHWQSQLMTYIIAVCAGINIALMVYYFRHRFKLQKAAGVGVVGVITGLFGIGCSACGSVLLSAVFGVGATSAFLGVMPLHGYEIGLLSIAMLLYSIYTLTQKIHEPGTCKVCVNSAKESER